MHGFKQADDRRKRQANYVEVVPFDPRNPASGLALDAVGSGFVESIARGKVGCKLGGGDLAKDDVGGFYV